MSDVISPAAPPRSVAAGRGLAWWGEAWALFTKNAGMWIVLGLLLIVIFAVLGFIPLLGSVVGALLTPVFAGSWMLAARKLEAGGPLELGDLFSAFKGPLLTPLIVLGALLVAVTMLVVVAIGALGFGAVMGVMVGGERGASTLLAGLGAGLLALLATLVLGALVGMALWFAPALVVFRDMPPIDALKASFAANLTNIAAFVVYGLIYLAAAIVASIPFGLGWIVLIPVVLISVYVSYRDVFGA